MCSSGWKEFASKSKDARCSWLSPPAGPNSAPANRPRNYWLAPTPSFTPTSARSPQHSPNLWQANLRRIPLTFLRGCRVESGPLLFKFGAATFRTFDLFFVVLAFIVFGNGQGQRELLVAVLAEILVVGHSHLPQHLS